jgi:hypothetical protein
MTATVCAVVDAFTDRGMGRRFSTQDRHRHGMFGKHILLNATGGNIIRDAPAVPLLPIDRPSPGGAHFVL